jgi:hypothetical protein
MIMRETHEDIRFKVIQELKESVLRSIHRIRNAKPQVYSDNQSQFEEYQKIIEEKKIIPLIIKNERIIKDVGKPDVEVFGGRILIEVKVKRSEFSGGFGQLSRYVEFYPYAEYAVITNHRDWEFYKVEKGTLADAHGTDLDYIIEDVLCKGVKVQLSTENVRNMFNPLILLEDEFRHIFKTYGEKDGALFEAYRNIMKRLYEEASEEEIERLYIRHTLMQMIVSACLTASSKKYSSSIKACSGADIEIEIVLPYLNWWKSLVGREIESPDLKFLRPLSDNVYSRALLLDWESGGKEDIFRELYEILIDAETRRKLGEYYTPLWLVEYMMGEVSKDLRGLKERIVLDPFCGSGTFLVVAFYRKIEEGQDPDNAIREIIGFDINPLAVSVARAELMIAYQAVRKGAVTPLVFNTDSASLLLRTPEKWEPTSFLDELKDLEKKAEYINSPIFTSTDVDFSEILKIEVILRECFREIAQSEDIRKELDAELGRLRNEKWEGSLTDLIVKTLADKKSVDAVAKLIEKYGNGVWAVSITSLFAPHIIRKVKVDTIITNPPWALLTQSKGSYGKLMRNKAKEILQGYKKTGQIITGSDISSVLLHGCLNVARREVAFLMPEEVLYVRNSYHGLGKILTYGVIKDCDGRMMEVGVDAFQHGRIPGIVFLKRKTGEMMCYSMNVKWAGSYSRALHLSDVKCSIERVENYGDYIVRVMAYTKTSSEAIKEKLGVQTVVPKADYIMGLFGGEKKKEAKRYAGLVFQIIGSYDKTAGQFSIRLSRTRTAIRISDYFLKPYWKKLIYRGEVFPFHLNGVHDILLSSEGEEKLKGFLRNRIIDKLSEDDKKNVESLIQEAKQPEKPRFLEKGKYYVIYRCTRTFASLVLSPQMLQKISDNGTFNVVIESHCSFISSDEQSKAYYYAAVLNYLAYKVTENEGAFERDQFLRPLIAILHAGMEWKGKKWQREIAKSGKKLQRSASRCFSGFIRRGMRVDQCFERLKTCPDTKELFESILETVDGKVNKKRLYESLGFVSKLKRT